MNNNLSTPLVGMKQPTDQDKEFFRLRIRKSNEAIKQQSLEEFNIFMRRFLQDLYKAFRKQRVAIQAAQTELAATIASGQQALVIMKFDEYITPIEDLLKARNPKFFDKCSHLRFVSATGITSETWNNIPERLQEQVWYYILQLNVFKESYLSPDVTDEEIDELFERSTRHVTKLFGERGLPTTQEEMVNITVELGRRVEQEALEEQKRREDDCKQNE